MFKYARKTLISGLTTVFNFIFIMKHFNMTQ